MEKSTRYLALDVLRGMTIVLMILVNNPGSWKYIYPPLRHAAWHGCTPTDLVFPFFLFAMGVSMFFSFSKYQNSLNRATIIKIVRRSVLIFGIGLFLHSFPQWEIDWSHVRIMGVLQRIALVYLVGSLLILGLSRKGLMVASGGILIGYWAIMWYFGGDDPYSLAGNATIGFDAFLLSEAHMYNGFGLSFEPEGVLSSLPAIVTTTMGYFAGTVISGSGKKDVPKKLLLWGALCAVIGWVWGLWFPINKELWTSSYVLYTGGLASITLAVLVYVIDIKGHKKWTGFFVVFGMNPLFIFAFAGLMMRALFIFVKIPTADGNLMPFNTWVYEYLFVPWAGNMNGSLFYAISCIIIFWLMGWVLYRNKIFIKV